MKLMFTDTICFFSLTGNLKFVKLRICSILSLLKKVFVKFHHISTCLTHKIIFTEINSFFFLGKFYPSFFRANFISKANKRGKNMTSLHNFHIQDLNNVPPISFNDNHYKFGWIYNEISCSSFSPSCKKEKSLYFSFSLAALKLSSLFLTFPLL